VELQLDGTQGAFFVDCSKKYLAMQLVPIEAIRPRLQKVDFSKLPLQEAIVVGNATASKKVAVFTDPDCPACRQFHDSMKQVVDKRKDIAFHLFLYPLPMHKEAYKKAQAIMCERSLSLLDDAFAGKELPEPKCSNEQVEKNLTLGKNVKIEGTPTIIREDGSLFNGPRQPDAMIQWIDGK
jgi:thiol:disulfide interchange protein DsbC